MSWKFDQFKVDLIWVEEGSQGSMLEGAQIDMGDGNFELDMLNHADSGEIDNGERVT
jgi:hypothetical protein